MQTYGKQTIDPEDIESVVKVFEENDMLTNGKYVSMFEHDVSEYVGCKYAVAVNSCTAALHLAVNSLGITESDEVIVPAISFVASSNCVLYKNAVPVFCDVEEDTLCMDYRKLEKLITHKTKAIILVDMTGQPCDYDEILNIANKYNLHIIQDAAHSLGSKYKTKNVGSYADITCFSFHPVKNITTCEGGMMVTNNFDYYSRALEFRNHGILGDFKERTKKNTHHYEMNSLGFNYRIPDVLCALGISQLKKLDKFVIRRNEIACLYNSFFENMKDVVTLLKNKHYSSYHIYILKLNLNSLTKSRDEVFKILRQNNIGVNVHYKPIYLHTYYKNIGYKSGICPIAENVYDEIITLPIYPLLRNDEIIQGCNKIKEILMSCRREIK